MNTGCPRAPVHDAALQLLQLLDQRFFGNVGPLPATELEAGKFIIFIFFTVLRIDVLHVDDYCLFIMYLLGYLKRIYCIIPHLLEAFAFP